MPLLMPTRIAPKPQLILDYTLFFNEEPPEDRISLIQHVSKDSILCELAALNYRLKPKDEVQIDTSLETQIQELEYFTMTPELFRKYSFIAGKFTKSKTDYPLIFNRQACLFCIEEIINSNSMQNIDGFKMAREEVWESILNYILAVNYAITQIREEKENGDYSWESLNPKLLPLNELMVEVDQIFTPYRGYRLIEHFLNHQEYKEIVGEYFQSKYALEPHHFIYLIMSMYMANSSDDHKLNFFYQVPEGVGGIFEPMSKRVGNTVTYKLLDIRKSPFIKFGKNQYILSDNTLLIEKTYSQFLNDFWFDWVKLLKNENGTPKFSIKQYRSVFGYFFESYLTQIIRKCFENYKYATVLLFDELKVTAKKGVVEIADVYLRSGNKILHGQAKSGSIYDNEKYGGNLEALYKKDRNAFFKNFGVNQLIESISLMAQHMDQLDGKFPKYKSYEIFPCIIFNDTAMLTPLMADIFNIRFQELVDGFSLKKVRIHRLNLIHVNDLERLEDSLSTKPKEIWELLRFNLRDKKFVPPFHYTLNSKWKGRKNPERILKIFEQLIKKYNPESDNGK